MFSIFFPFRLISGTARFLLNLLVFITCILTVTAFMGDRGWSWNMTTHFRLQYLLIQLLALLIVSLSYWFQRREGKFSVSRVEMWLTLVFLMFFAGLNLTQIAPYYWPMEKPSPEAARATQRVKLMHMNLFGMTNRQHRLVINAIRQQNPDMVDLVEYTPNWFRTLERSGVFNAYPYRVAGRANMALYSKIPLRNAHLTFTDPHQKNATYANIMAGLTLNREPVTLLVAHPASPYLPIRLSWQRESFEAWKKERPQMGRNLVIVGDLNTAPWSPEFESLLHTTGLRDSQLGYGLQPSWPMLLPMFGLSHPGASRQLWALPLGIPIDHVLVSNRILVLSRQTGPFVGSDHLPVIVELGLSHHQ